MPRPRLCRKVTATPKASYFKPRGVPLSELGEAYLAVEGLEALRLADLESLTTAEAARRMGVSRHTFGRILGQARRAVADALVNALALRIEGGDYAVDGPGHETPPAARRTPDMNIVAVSAEGPSLNDAVDARFGRAAGFVVVNLDTMATSWLDNGASQAMAHGAGIQTAERIADAGAGVLLTGIVGPKAFQALEAAGVKVGQNLEGLTVGQAVNRYKAGEVPFADGPNK
ncbi:hypothetical protein NNJEOMEG_02306 [Fundidesulfovibrio magnetotacticus]|uniref:UPF0251 protein NNJEOMEG_02306 n=1 Tax=Fundidesulfovibrio magnetotacticus TaxID=2730080 RepID=A0A6V8LV46_9BACT|nr:DUF134 domain-containing protein [Fundidesulfovibrio magnetotacticus]GFK94461.1 hypothetical protein NNJEOMEG_02306 [Fundidesulfovibrio magnetotacticus]